MNYTITTTISEKFFSFLSEEARKKRLLKKQLLKNDWNIIEK